MTHLTPTKDAPRVLDRLSQVSALRGVPTLAERLVALDRFVRTDLATFSQELDALPRGARAIHKAAHHLLDLRGKHLRPLCVALASRFGAGFTESARALAVAVELVHSATLLHDDVVDLAERRRGQPAACTVYGNAASIFAGDWLLIAALRKIRESGVEVLDKMLAVIDEMIAAESVQLERRGKITGAREDYFAIVEGKTAALFRWAMVAGARAAELTPAAETALERYGLHLGVAFQAVDDELDYATGGTGKDALADLREGKVTFPLVVALERDPSLRPLLEELLGVDAVTGDALAGIANQVRASGALVATRALAEEHVQRALAVLEELPAGPAREALVTVALASLERTS
ncbi:MAG: polyprenyl synthetase family protein [Myxococcales bacterium]|nr:polyprenyl synthetase family protein [Myxococcales bacterium]